MAEKKILTGLNPQSYEHDFDKKALERLKTVPKLDTVLGFITKHAVEKVYSIQYTGSHLRVSEKRYPEIYSYLERACKILDIPEYKMPELYIKWDYTIDADTVGSDHPIMVLNSGLIDLCTDDEIMFLIGHELGHIKSNHMLYHMAAEILVLFMDYIPLLGKVSELALYYWDRMSDLTADRAGLLCCQNKDAMISALMKMAGVPLKDHNQISTESFIEQANAFHGLNDIDAEFEELFQNVNNSDDEINNLINDNQDGVDINQDNVNGNQNNNLNTFAGRLREARRIAGERIREAKLTRIANNILRGKEEKFIRMAAIAGSKEPWTVMRASELLKWIDSEEYAKIMG